MKNYCCFLFLQTFLIFILNLIISGAKGFVQDDSFFKGCSKRKRFSLTAKEFAFVSGETPRILIVDAIDKSAAQPLLNIKCEVEFKYGLQDQDLAGILNEYDGVVIRSANTITKAMIEHAPKLLVIGRAGVGVDNIDVNAAIENTKFVVNSPNGNSVAVAEHTFALMLGVARRLCEANLSMAQGKWEKKNLMGLGLKGKTLGILGFGSIGKEVSIRAKAFGMKLITTDTSLSLRESKPSDYDKDTKDRFAQLCAQGIEPLPFADVLKESDFLTLHVPLTDETRNLIGEPELQLMKKNAILVNVARGGVVDEKALLSVMEKGHLGGAALDVFVTEKNPTDPVVQQLSRLSNVISTPHIGAATPDAGFEVLIEVCEAMASLFQGIAPKSACVSPFNLEYDLKLSEIKASSHRLKKKCAS
mmetsp:Transcript_41358/g.54371  ORF Transcript_41358/g.54371 Transcript_41358/m.54371 type:complete len:417 (-) Transcript_41358:174-1424(-)